MFTYQKEAKLSKLSISKWAPHKCQKWIILRFTAPTLGKHTADHFRYDYFIITLLSPTRFVCVWADKIFVRCSLLQYSFYWLLARVQSSQVRNSSIGLALIGTSLNSYPTWSTIFVTLECWKGRKPLANPDFLILTIDKWLSFWASLRLVRWVLDLLSFEEGTTYLDRIRKN